MDKKLELLMTTGLTLNEARVYITLLKLKPSTGYKISKESGVPRSKIYSILSSLKEKGYILTSDDKPPMYSSLSVPELIDHLKTKTQNNIGQLQKELNGLEKVSKTNTVWSLKSYEQILEKVSYQIKHAQKRLYIQIYSEDLTPALISDLSEADNRLDDFVVILFSHHHRYDLPFRRFYKHFFESDKNSDYGGRWINVVSDSSKTLFGKIPENSSNISITYTTNESMVFLAQEYILHDAYCLRILQKLHTPAEKMFGKNLEDVRNIYFNDNGGN